MPRKSKQEIAAEATVALIAACLAAIAGVRGQGPADAILAEMQRGSDLPFAPDSTDPFAAMPDERKSEVAASVAAAKVAGASGNELRAVYGMLLSGPVRRDDVLRAFGYDGKGYVAPSYVEYRDGDPRAGSRHARQHGARADARRAAEREAAEAALAEAVAAPKGRSKASREAYATRVAECEAALASIA